MGNVYAVDAEKNLILYSTGNYICLRTSAGENLSRPIILCNDYASNLSDLVYNDTIYYVYQNTNRDIILRSVIEQNNLYIISNRNTPDCFYPQIATIQKTLILFYFVKNPVNNSYCLKSLLPFQPEQKLLLPGTLFSSEASPSASGEAVFSSLPALHIFPVDGALLVHLSHDGESHDRESLDREEYIFTINESLQCDKLNKTQEMLSFAQTERNKNEGLLSEAQKQISKLQSDLSARDQLIQSIRRQYEELMSTAIKYREEAVKWHNKFYKNK